MFSCGFVGFVRGWGVVCWCVLVWLVIACDSDDAASSNAVSSLTTMSTANAPTSTARNVGTTSGASEAGLENDSASGNVEIFDGSTAATSDVDGLTKNTSDAAPDTTVGEQPEVDGATIFYEATCDACHGAGGEGGSGSSLRASTLDFDEVVNVIRFGVPRSQMKGWDFQPKPPGLTQEEIIAVATYVMALRS